MKALISAVAAAAILSIPALSFAQQSDAQPTRAQVRAELAQLEKAGYNPNANDTAYPANIQAAQAKVAQGNVTAQAQAVSYGPSTGGSSASGRTGAAVRTGTPAAAQAVYFGQ
ncbi:hypothetical protein BGLT_04376 [Caballeronia glathei]|jgi:hypothetical protein|uniref:Purine nucleoside phosphorylase n=1 Tax=Caballeronia glathei TaxID=60547 RepID=A0A069PUV3_9BURK|nr:MULTISPECIES: DUF4148 domain-containing protein [Burkholderiaceae]KDR43614.1 hypothetical protein BG61_32430 [Caballeronia glathei]TCK43746.1 uncharacterized protein DUF4148 [Paraburkholderia sp. BL8N3]CDY75477.1 hypothetical protein BGLT_04376 [Caballeronia glathei]